MGSLNIKQMNLVEMNALIDKWPCLDSARLLNDSLNWHLLAEKIEALKRSLNSHTSVKSRFSRGVDIIS